MLAPALLHHLVDRMHTRMALSDALRMFADELDDPSADLVVRGTLTGPRSAADPDGGPNRTRSPLPSAD
jgi:hypothetical protein